MSPKTRLWQHNNLWRIQDHRQITDRHGTTHDAWESRRDENGVLFFVSEEQAREYMESGGQDNEQK